MNFHSKNTLRKRAGQGRVFRVEALEERALLAASAETFSAPSLNDLIVLARQGHDTAPAAINRVLQALESQLTSGPLADLTAGTVDGNGFVTEVQSLDASYAQNIGQQLLPEFPNVDTLLNLQGERIVADMTSLNQQNSVGLISDSQAVTDAQAAINSLTAGPLFSLGTPLSGYATATQNFESDLNTLAQSLSSSATTPLTPAQVSVTMLAETVAYQTDIHAALQVTHPNISNTVDLAIYSLGNTALTIASETSTATAQSDVTSAISAFDTAILDTTGVFGPQGVISISVASGRGFAPRTTDTRPASSLTSVSGTASSGGPATLTATVNSASGQAVPNLPVSFTLDGAFAGVAVTDSNGVATLSDVPTSDAVGTDTGGVFAYFAGNINLKTSVGTGDLTVSQAPSQAPAITSADSTTFTVGTARTFTVTTTGSPTSALTETGALPSGVTFVDNGNGTATLAGTPAAGTGATYALSVTAANGVTPNATQSFTLTVDQAPAITSAAAKSFAISTASTFTVTTTGFPTSALTETGALPSGVTFVGNSNGTATLAGTPAAGTAGTYPLTITAANGVTPDGTQSFTLTVAAAQAPAITSAGSTTFTAGTAGTFTVTTTGVPTSALTETGALPSGVTFVDNSNGTATLAGTPAAGSGATYALTITAANGVTPNATQSFTLTVNQAPAITSADSTTFTVGTAGTFTVTTTGFPTSALTETGALPSGVTFVDNSNDKATLAGTPAAGTAATYTLTITADNGVVPNATQSFTLTVAAG